MEEKNTSNVLDYRKIIDDYVDTQWEILLTRGVGPKTKALFDELDKKIERILPWLTNKILSEPKR